MKIGYVRVSTEDQSGDLQRDALAAAGCEKFFSDVASGAKTERDGLSDAIAFARPGDALVVWKLDRLGRSVKHLLDLAQQFKDKGIELISLQDKIDTTTATGKMVFTVLGAIAEFELDLIRERTRAGLTAARARGRKGGRPALAPEKIQMIKTMFQDKNLSPDDIAQALGVHRATVFKYAK